MGCVMRAAIKSILTNLFLGGIFAIVFLIFFYDKDPGLPIKEAVGYRLVSNEDFSFPGRTRVQYHIAAPDAKTPEQYIHTGYKAALDLEEEYGADVVWVTVKYNMEHHTPEYHVPTSWAADVSYAPDGGGNSGSSPYKNQTYQEGMTMRNFKKKPTSK